MVPGMHVWEGMSECSIHPSTPEKWIASMRDSLARTLALLESRQAYLREPDQVFTEKSCVLLTKYDPNIFLENVAAILSNGLGTVLADLAAMGYDARWGVFAHPMSGQTIREIDGSCWLQLQRFQTRAGERANHGIHFQTSTGTVRRKTRTERFSMFGFLGLFWMWPTPTAHNAKSESKRNTPTLEAQVGGVLNPDWVRVANGVSNRVGQLKGYGNAQVPLQAAVAWKLLGGE